MTFVVLLVLGVLWLIANTQYESTREWRYRRRRAAFAWSFAGAIIGSSFGIAGMGSAIAGTLPGAIVGYLLASNLMKKDTNPLE